MLLGCNKYLPHFLLKPIVTIGLIFSFSIAASAQIYYNDVVEKYPRMNPLLYGAFRKPVKPNPLLSEYIKPSTHELMYWPNFPLNYAQLEARQREWERKNNRPFGEQILSGITTDIIKSSVNSLIYGKKMPVAVAPKF
jgi:hypothetical protein